MSIWRQRRRITTGGIFMADYEDQNSSEYKDMNQETQAADQNPQNGQPIPPQNNGQDPYCRIHRMTDRSRLRILDRILTGRIHRMTDRSRLRILDRILTGRIHRTTDRSRLRILDRIHTGRISRTADSSHRRTGSRRIGRISTITDSRPTGRTSRSVRDAKRTPSRRSP